MSSRLLAACLLAAAGAAGAADDERVAFILGNAEYRHAKPLANPANDAQALAASFTRLGYEVIHGKDLTQAALAAQTRTFFDRLRGVEVAVFFYAGHGLQIDGRNYLVPVDFDPARKGALVEQLVPLDAIVEGMSRRARASLVFLDACRNNPFAAELKATLASGRAVELEPGRDARTVGTGLAEIRGRARTLIAFATQPGNVAADGSGANSPFTEGLLKNLEEPGLEVRELLTRVRVDVLQQTAGVQIPWDHSSLLSNFYLKKRPRRFVSPP